MFSRQSTKASCHTGARLPAGRSGASANPGRPYRARPPNIPANKNQVSSRIQIRVHLRRVCVVPVRLLLLGVAGPKGSSWLVLKRRVCANDPRAAPPCEVSDAPRPPDSIFLAMPPLCVASPVLQSTRPSRLLTYREQLLPPRSPPRCISCRAG